MALVWTLGQGPALDGPTLAMGLRWPMRPGPHPWPCSVALDGPHVGPCEEEESALDVGPCSLAHGPCEE